MSRTISTRSPSAEPVVSGVGLEVAGTPVVIHADPFVITSNLSDCQYTEDEPLAGGPLPRTWRPHDPDLARVEGDEAWCRRQWQRLKEFAEVPSRRL